MAQRDTGLGLLSATAAFLLWGLIPLYWRVLHGVPAGEVLAHRIAWSLPCLLLLLWARGAFGELGRALASPRTAVTLLVTTLLIGGNWFTFLWAVTHDHVLDSSLGYYINPLVSVLFGFLFLGERLRRAQRLAVGLAAVGIGILTARHGLPWISLTLAVSFGLYGLLRKVVDATPMVGLFVEVALLWPLAVGYLAWLALQGSGALGTRGTGLSLLLAASGPITVIPLLLFTYGTRALTLSTVGFVQYLTPTGHFILAVMVFGEPFSRAHLVAFAFIWAALLLYSLDLRRAMRRRSA
jgi:chloramphenicol-sensitive protein RarD